MWKFECEMIFFFVMIMGSGASFEWMKVEHHAIVNGPAGDFLVSNQFDLTNQCKGIMRYQCENLLSVKQSLNKKSVVCLCFDYCFGFHSRLYRNWSVFFEKPCFLTQKKPKTSNSFYLTVADQLSLRQPN